MCLTNIYLLQAPQAFFFIRHCQYPSLPLLRIFWEGYDLYIRDPIIVSSTTKTAATTWRIVTKAENKTKILLDHQLDRFNQNIRVSIQVKFVQKVLTYDTLSCIININKHADIFATRKIKHYHAATAQNKQISQ